MNNIQKVEFKDGSREERLPDFQPDFPYIASCVQLGKFIRKEAPWHWHKAVELFYITEGSLTYYTPNECIVFPAGSGGLINSNVLHMTRVYQGVLNTTQLIHIFDPLIISGGNGNLIDQKYVLPLVSASQMEVVVLLPDNPLEKKILNKLHASFQISKSDFAYEVKLRDALSDIWCDILAYTEHTWKEKAHYSKTDNKVKQMMVYINENYAQKLSIENVASAAFVSQRECYRAFKECLHMTPMDYIKGYRLQKACELLAETKESITAISQACGLGSSSYFGEVFHERFGCTPRQYRVKWQKNDSMWQ